MPQLCVYMTIYARIIVLYRLNAITKSLINVLEYSLIENEIITLSMKEASRRIVSDSSDTDLDEYNLKLKS